MQTLLTKKTASLTELREPNKVIEMAGNEPVAIMNRNVAIGYFVPVGAVQEPRILGAEEAKKLLAKHKKELQPVLDYLRDK